MHEFAERFAEAWARPTPEGLVALLCEDGSTAGIAVLALRSGFMRHSMNTV